MGLEKPVLERKPLVEAAAGSYIEVGIWKRLCWRESFGGSSSKRLYKYEAIELGG